MRVLTALLVTILFSLVSYAGDRINLSPRDIDFLSLEFGDISVGKYGLVQLGLNAPKEKALTISELYIVGDMFAATTNCPASVEAGKYCAINVYFTPTAKGDQYGEMGIKTSEGNVLLRLYGSGI